MRTVQTKFSKYRRQTKLSGFYFLYTVIKIFWFCFRPVEKVSPNNRSRLSKQHDEKRWQQTQAKLQMLLQRQKEVLKRDILRKRALLEKDLKIQIQVRVPFDSLPPAILSCITMRVFRYSSKRTQIPLPQSPIVSWRNWPRCPAVNVNLPPPFTKTTAYHLRRRTLRPVRSRRIPEPFCSRRLPTETRRLPKRITVSVRRARRKKRRLRLANRRLEARWLR